MLTICQGGTIVKTDRGARHYPHTPLDDKKTVLLCQATSTRQFFSCVRERYGLRRRSLSSRQRERLRATMHTVKRGRANVFLATSNRAVCGFNVCSGTDDSILRLVPSEQQTICD